MASQTMHIVEYRTEPPPPQPPYQPNSISAPVDAPDINAALQSRNELNRAIGIGQSVDVLV